MGINVVRMDSTEYAAEVATKALKALEGAGETVNSASKKSGISRTTLDRKLKTLKGVSSLTVRELFDIAKLAKVAPHTLTEVYAVEERLAS